MRAETFIVKRKVDWSFLILFLAFAGMSSWMILFRPLASATAFCVIDDAMYYLKIAQNVIATGRCTYDGITLTNGFHPLWLLCLLPVYAVARDPFVAMRLVFVLVFLLLCACLLLLRRASDRLHLPVSGRFVMGFLILLNLRTFTLFYGLLESPLVLLTYLFYVVFSLKTGSSRWRVPRVAFWNGMLIGLCFLARLDSFLLAVAYGLILTVRAIRDRTGWLEWIKAAMASATGCLLVALPYLITNQVVFGRLSTVSAYMKGQSPSLQSISILRSWFLSQFLPRFQYILGLESIPRAVMAGAWIAGLMVGFVFLVWAIRRSARRADLIPLSDFWLFAGIHLGFICLVAPLDAVASVWYLVPEILSAGLLFGWAMPDFRWRRVHLVPAFVLALLAVQVAIYPAFLRRKTMTFAKLEVARALREKEWTGVRGCMFDSGIVSYFSQRDFVSLNGLIGDFEQADRLRRGDLSGLVRAGRIEILVLDTPKALLPELAVHERWRSRTETRFENFQEAPKPFVVYSVTPETIGSIWTLRYGPR